jgi:hypothetical protein
VGRRLDNSDRGALISVEAARRIAEVVRKVEGGDRNIPPPAIRTAYDEGDPVRIGKTTSAWAKGETAELDLIYETDCETEGGSGSGGETLTAHNLSHDVASDTKVIVALAGNGCWYLVEAAGCGDDGSGSGCECVSIGGQDLTTLEGYDDTKTQILGHEAGCLKWFDTTECDAGSGGS